jgi:uncharacterized protein (UPF0297 family)
MKNYLQEIEAVSNNVFTILKYKRGNRIEQLVEYLFSKEDCKASRHDISVNIFKKNYHTMEIDFYKEGLERRGVLITFEEKNINGRVVEMWKLKE